METIEYRNMDKSDWPNGVWLQEPDKKQWQDEATGLPCLIVRNGGGNLCGYVGIAEGHPLFQLDYSALYDRDVDIDIHGGLTYADFCQEGKNEATICHLPAPGEPDRVWWLGFDTAHSGDLTPKYPNTYPKGYKPVYRDFAYVEAECKKLAAQLHDLR